jgi:hypothetical protein
VRTNPLSYGNENGNATFSLKENLTNGLKNQEAQKRPTNLLHQQHLTGAFDGVGQAALIVGGHPSVFARKDAALVGNVLAEEIRVFEIQRVGGKIDFRFRTRGTVFRRALAAFIFIFVGFAGHNYLISR